MLHIHRHSEQASRIRFTPVTLCALIGAVIAFVLAGAIVAAFWVVVGAVLGAGVGWAVAQPLARTAAADQAENLSKETKDTLTARARKLDIAGRSHMDKSELAEAIVETEARHPSA